MGSNGLSLIYSYLKRENKEILIEIRILKMQFQEFKGYVQL